MLGKAMVTALLKRLGDGNVFKRFAETGVLKRVAEIIAAVTVVGAAVGWLFGPRIQEALAQEFTAQLVAHKTSDHTPVEVALREIRATLENLSGAQAETKKVQVQTTALLGLIVCKDAGGTPYPSVDGGLCIFTGRGVQPRPIPLSEFNTLFAEVLARAAGEKPPAPP